MPRFWLGLAVVLALTGCDRDGSKPPPEPAAPAKPAVHRIKEAPPQAGTPAAPAVDIAGLDDEAALVATMKARVMSSPDEDQQALARFAPVDADMLLTRPLQLLPEYLRPSEDDADGDPGQSFVRLVEQEVPADIREAIRAAGKVKVLAVETCGADVSAALGIPNDYDEGSAPQYLDQARFEVALERDGLKPMPLPADLRDVEGERESIAGLNRQLFDLRGGPHKDIRVVIDLSSGCAAQERPVKLVTEPAFESLRIMPEFYHGICVQRGGDAWSAEQCRWWEAVTQDITITPGTYYYVARWPDGQEKRGRFIIDDLVTEAIEEGTDTLLLDIR
jgi:hypothetical protein